ncbi:MAG: hypothetical protein JAZ03_08265 [Candidatus Thiodiazotropha taylori]|nr:hypothetical protein [Candidatus Thiodiazotropha taylori]MCW4333919.1 hypothetical protein [Candidatus Thiodiazotropha endolucinida]
MNAKDFDIYFVKTGLDDIWLGAQPADRIFQFSFQGPRLLILNTDESDGRGLHWVTVYVPVFGPLEFFDSLGQSPGTYRDYFRSWLVSSGRGYVRNGRRYQDYGTDTCGEFCIYYALKRLSGETMMQIVQTLDSRNLSYNELIVSDFVCNLFDQ